MKRTAAIVMGKAAAELSRRFRLGGGTALPGLIAERIDPGIVAGLASRLGRGSVLITGTNGKTTTARMVRSIVEAAGLEAVANREGSNMMRGLAAALVEAATWEGAMPSGHRRIGVFEVDEATVPQVARAVGPPVVVFTNLFRDQLDRYGEVETVAALWRKAVEGFPSNATIVVNADDPSVSSLIAVAPGGVITYGIEGTPLGSGVIEHAADARWCTACGAELAYDALFYAHLGHWRCPNCGHARPAPDVACIGVTGDLDSTVLSVRAASGVFETPLRLTGLYNVYNALAAAATSVALGLDGAVIRQGLASSTAAFGRQERLQVRGRGVQMMLAKNPAGLNQVLRVITAGEKPANIAFFLNDNIADGRDVSWIWDVDFEHLAGKVGSLTASGGRAWDMALRLKYAGLGDRPHVEPDTTMALRSAIRRTPERGSLYVVPTYTAMLDVRNTLGRWAGRGSFWEGD